jgi:hypothetical protein
VVTDCGYIESSKVLTLKQYIHIYNEIVRQAAAAASDVSGNSGDTVSNGSMLDASVLLMQYVSFHSIHFSVSIVLNSRVKNPFS